LRGEAAGDIDGGSGLRVMMESSLGCRLEHVKGIRRITRAREEERGQREVVGYQRCTKISRSCLQMGGTPVRDFVVLSRGF
jgi:hypothetical protein